MPDVNQISESLIRAVKKQQSFEKLILQFENIGIQQLLNELSNDKSKKAFWINVYNAYFQIFKRNKEAKKSTVFKDKNIRFADLKLSLDNIEHGILRRFRFKFSFGYLANPFPANSIKRLAVFKVDYRIHFALNCGAISCPPIAFYTADQIDQQLENATLGFLENETDIFKDKKEIHITQLFRWYLADFGGYSGIRHILSQKLNLDLKGYRLIFKNYSWEEYLDNYDESKFGV